LYKTINNVEFLTEKMELVQNNVFLMPKHRKKYMDGIRSKY